jgi:hypothetical protein
VSEDRAEVDAQAEPADREHADERPLAVVSREQASADRNGRDRDVDQEDRSPMGTGKVRRDEHAAEDLADHRSGRQRERIEPDGPQALAPLEAELDAGERLREHQRGADALHDARCDQRRRIGRAPVTSSTENAIR